MELTRGVKMGNLAMITLVALNLNIETRQKIVVIDTAVNEYQLSMKYMCKDGSVSPDGHSKSFHSRAEADKLGFSTLRHGENVVSLIGNGINSDKYCVYHIFWNYQNNANYNYVQALKLASQLTNVVGLNLSISTENTSVAIPQEETYIGQMISKGVKVVAALGNEDVLLTKENCFTFPACLQAKFNKSQFFVVGSNTKMRADEDFNFKSYSNSSTYLEVSYEDGTKRGWPVLTGTSQAAAVYTGKLFNN